MKKCKIQTLVQTAIGFKKYLDLRYIFLPTILKNCRDSVCMSLSLSKLTPTLQVDAFWRLILTKKTFTIIYDWIIHTMS